MVYSFYISSVAHDRVWVKLYWELSLKQKFATQCWDKYWSNPFRKNSVLQVCILKKKKGEKKNSFKILLQAPAYDEDGETIGMTTNSDVSSHPQQKLNYLHIDEECGMTTGFDNA